MTDARGRLTRRSRGTLALFGGAALATMAWPGPAGADTSLGGYSGVAQAEVIRIQIFDPTIPIPADPGKPQIDGGIGYAKSSADTGPVTRATASYLWPGDVIGDGFGQLAGNDKAQYMIQVNSRYPETASAPAKNTAQLTNGNGMTTSTDGFHTKATVTGLGIAGPDTDLLSGIGEGLRNLPGFGGPSAPPTKQLPPAPVPVGELLAGLATVQNVKSTTDVDIVDKTITSTAQTFMSEVSLLDGLITIDGMKLVSTTMSNGKKAVTTGSLDAAAITVAGVKLGIGGKGVDFGGSDASLPDVPSSASDLLAKIGIGVQFAPTERTVDGATGSLAATGLVFSIDTQPLKTALNVGGLIAPLQDAISKIPKIGSQLGPLLGLGPKIVFRVGDVASSATAAPAYVPPPIKSGGSGGNPGGSGGNPGGVGNPGGGTGPIDTGGGTGPIDNGGGTLPGTNDQTPGTVTPPSQAAGFSLPGLGTVPRLLVLGALAAALAFGWLFRSAGAFILGGSRACAFGLSTGVPDLRKG